MCLLAMWMVTLVVQTTDQAGSFKSNNPPLCSLLLGGCGVYVWGEGDSDIVLVVPWKFGAVFTAAQI